MQAPRFWWDKPGVASALLAPLGALYGAVAARRIARPGARAGIPVICVGNPTVGGAGKTPAAIAVARMLVAAGERPMFLSRGYGGSRAGPLMVETSHSAAEVGDEPVLLARVAPAVIARDRLAGARFARDLGASVVVMDDGFQNPSLAKDVSILVIDAARGLGNTRVLPAGPLRAPLDVQLDRASAILIVGEGAAAAPVVVAARALDLPLFHGRLEPDATTVAALSGRRVLAFAGIGDPEKFFATLARAGIAAPVRRSFADHHRYRASEAAALVAEAERGDLALLTTEKDLARLRGDAGLAPLAERTQALPVTMQIDAADDFGRLVLGAVAGIGPRTP
jgi:tetraacyldisaccharide 4'-kinase